MPRPSKISSAPKGNRNTQLLMAAAALMSGTTEARSGGIRSREDRVTGDPRGHVVGPPYHVAEVPQRLPGYVPQPSRLSSVLGGQPAAAARTSPLGQAVGQHRLNQSRRCRRRPSQSRCFASARMLRDYFQLHELPSNPLQWFTMSPRKKAALRFLVGVIRKKGVTICMAELRHILSAIVRFFQRLLFVHRS